jgi:hypothetical protein
MQGVRTISALIFNVTWGEMPLKKHDVHNDMHFSMVWHGCCSALWSYRSIFILALVQYGRGAESLTRAGLNLTNLNQILHTHRTQGEPGLIKLKCPVQIFGGPNSYNSLEKGENEGCGNDETCTQR